MFNEPQFEIGDIAKLSITREAGDKAGHWKSGDIVILRAPQAGPYLCWYVTVLRNRVDVPFAISPGNLEPVHPLLQLAMQAKG